MPRDRRLALIAAAALATAAIWICALLPRAATLEVTILDVGEGLAIVARSPSGRILVMDCGTSSWRKGNQVGEKLVAPYLQSMGVDTIDVAVLSHPHADHISGFAGLVQAKPPRLVLDIGARHGSPYYIRFLKAVKDSGADYRTARRGQTIELGGGATAELLSPDPARRSTDLNENSIALRIKLGEVAILLAADTGDEAERDMLDSGMPLRSQVLQVGHHGGSDSSSAEFLAGVRPEIAVISCGYRNEYGHPSDELIDRLRSIGAITYRTDRNGAVTITTDGQTITARPFRR